METTWSRKGRKEKEKGKKVEGKEREIKLIENKCDSKLPWELLCNAFSKRESTAIKF